MEARVALAAVGVICSLLAGPALAEATLPGRNGAIFVPRFIKDRHVTEPPLYGLFSVRPDGRGLRSIRHDAITPALSAQGKRLAYSFNGHIYVAGPDGRGAKRIVRGHSPSWSPDGRQLAYLDPELDPDSSGNELGVIDLRTRAVRTLAIYAASPAWSPTGDWIAYIDNVELGPPAISRIRSDGTGRGTVWRSSRDPATELDFSPDGRRLAFFRSNSDYTDLEVVSINGGGTRLVTRRTGRYAYETRGVSWSPDGRQIAYTAAARSETFLRFDLFRVPAKGGKPKVVLTKTGSLTTHGKPAWQPR